MSTPSVQLLCRLLDVRVPFNASEGFGMMVDGASQVITEIKVDGAAARAGVQEGDVIMTVDNTVVTDASWMATNEEGVFLCGAPTAIMPASQAVNPEAEVAAFKLLRPLVEGEMAKPQLDQAGEAAVMARLEAAEAAAKEKAQSEALRRAAAEQDAAEREEAARLEEARAYAEASAPSRDPYAEARAHYPWATEILTADDQVKTKYNMVRGTVLQPLPQVVVSKDAARLKREIFSNPRMSASVGVTHGASGSGASPSIFR